MNRRDFLAGCGASMASLALSRITHLSFMPEDAAADMLVVVFCRGGYDGLNLVAPVNDTDYIAARELGLRLTDAGDKAGLPLANGFKDLDFRLHPKAASLKELYDSNALAIVHACGLTNGTRSHFDAQDLIERGTLTDKTLTEGWLTRYLKTKHPAGRLPAIAATRNLPVSLLGSDIASSINNLADFKLNGDPRFTPLLEKMYTGPDAVHTTGVETLATLRFLNGKVARDTAGKPLPYVPDAAAAYPTDGRAQELSKSLKTIAQLIKLQVGLGIATVDFGGWDTHENQAGTFAAQLEGLANSLSAFYNDLNNYHNRLTVVVMSEFGRRLRSNKSAGTDHGHGNAMLVMGGNVNGGKLYGTWPGLATEQLDERVDLAVTTDYRNVLSEVLVRRLAAPKLSYIFPHFTTYQPVGIVRGPALTVE